MFRDLPHDPHVQVPTDQTVCGIILAGGRSNRMGFDKLAAEVGGIAMLERVCAALSGFCREIVIVGNGGPELTGVPRTTDARPGYEGPLAGIEAGLAATTAEVAFVCAGDMPFVDEHLARSLLSLVGQGARAAVPVHPKGRPHPLFAAYARGVGMEVGRALDDGTRSMRGMLSRVSEAGRIEYIEDGIHRFGEPEVMLMNVNSPEDLEVARRVHATRKTSS